MAKKAPSKTPTTLHLGEEHEKKINRLIGYAMMHDVRVHPGRVIRTLIEMAQESPEFLKAIKEVDERERESYREKRRAT